MKLFILAVQTPIYTPSILNKNHIAGFTFLNQEPAISGNITQTAPLFFLQVLFYCFFRYFDSVFNRMALGV